MAITPRARRGLGIHLYIFCLCLDPQDGQMRQTFSSNPQRICVQKMLLGKRRSILICDLSVPVSPPTAHTHSLIQNTHTWTGRAASRTHRKCGGGGGCERSELKECGADGPGHFHLQTRPIRCLLGGRPTWNLPDFLFACVCVCVCDANKGCGCSAVRFCPNRCDYPSAIAN